MAVLFIVRKEYKVRVFSVEAINEPGKGGCERTVTLKHRVQNLKVEGASALVPLIVKDEENVNLTRVHRFFYI